MTTPATDWVVRVEVTPEQKKELRKLALDRSQDVRELITEALYTSPVTKKVMG